MQGPRLHIFFLFLFIGLCLPAFATHNRAGEITYEHLGGLTYRVTITTYTRVCSECADRPTLNFFWGDTQESDVVARSSGDMVAPEIRRNIYTKTHTFIGPGVFTIYFTDENRNQGIVNIPGSIDRAFHVESEMVVNPFLEGGVNSSPILLNPPIDDACLNQRYIHNPGAYDPDGDSISYELVIPKVQNGIEVPLYSYPDQISPGPDNQISLIQKTGDFIWDSPKRAGEYNVAIKMSEYRNGLLVGSVFRDMQITVGVCNNTPPEILDFEEDTCIIGGTAFKKDFRATDNNNEAVQITVLGEMFESVPPKASYTILAEEPLAKTELSVITDCEDIRPWPYRFLVIAKDYTNPNPVVDIRSLFVKVIGPAPLAPTCQVTPDGIQVQTPNTYSCPQADQFLVYRKRNATNFIPGYCQTGMPPELGYTLVTSLPVGEGFLDKEVEKGFSYCYRLVAVFENGSESQVSEENCAGLPVTGLLPIKASVGQTGESNGIDSLNVFLSNERDTLDLFPPNYTLSLFDRTTNSLLSQSTSPSYGNLDTAFQETANTLDKNRRYQFVLESGGATDTTALFAPPFLDVFPGDSKLTLICNSFAPWIDSSWTFEIMDENEVLISTQKSPFPTIVLEDLDNNQEYCIRAQTHGYIPGPDIATQNFSQTVCAVPIDNEAPCFPEWTIKLDCDISENPQFTYTFPANCANDLERLSLYGIDQSNVAQVVAEFSEQSGSVALPIDDYECFFVTTEDFNGNVSPNSVEQCINPCVSFSLPNVISPNGDGINDTWSPLTNKFVSKLELRIWNRWGETVFKTTDVDFSWDGKHYQSGKALAPGTYFYGVDYFYLKDGEELSNHLESFITHTGF